MAVVTRQIDMSNAKTLQDRLEQPTRTSRRLDIRGHQKGVYQGVAATVGMSAHEGRNQQCAKIVKGRIAGGQKRGKGFAPGHGADDQEAKGPRRTQGVWGMERSRDWDLHPHMAGV
tara:strand:+ start:1432 stop:1779 length:348 start_codon:yes stop_codon:yes gene_type:complete